MNVRTQASLQLLTYLLLTGQVMCNDPERTRMKVCVQNNVILLK